MKRQSSSFARRVYSLLLRTWPRDFRSQYGSEAAHVFERLHAEAAAVGLRALFSLYARTLFALPIAGVRERWAVRRDASGHGAREHWLPVLFDALRGEVRAAARGLLKRPGFAFTAMLLIGLGIGASTTIFSVVDGVLLRPLPYPHPERLITMQVGESSMPLPDYVDVQQQITALDGLGGIWQEWMALTGDGEPERVRMAMLTPDVFPLLGARAERGRLPGPDDYRAGAPEVAVISYGLWQRRWGGDPSVIGRTIRLDKRVYRVTGVLARDFVRPEALSLADVEVFATLDVKRPDAQRRDFYVLTVLGRLKADATRARLDSQLSALSNRLAEQYPVWLKRDGTPRSFTVEPLTQATIGSVKRALWLFFGAVGLMLLIACANVANLFLARSTDRAQEMALRAALGASRVRILGQVLTESVVLALAGGALGVLLAFAGVNGFRALEPGSIPRLAEVTVDLRILAFAVLLSGLTGVIFGVAPAFFAARVSAGRALSASRTRITTGSGSARVRSLLVVAELSFALILLTGAGLLFSSFIQLNRVQTGFQPAGLLTLQLQGFSSPGWADQNEALSARRVRFVNALEERLSALPGVHAVGASWTLPFSGTHCCWSSELIPAAPSTDTLPANMHAVTRGYLRALSATLLRGRDFNAGDYAVIHSRNDAPFTAPAIIDRPGAERLWPGADPIGQHLKSGGRDLLIIGVVEPIRHWDLNEPQKSNVYLPYSTVADIIGLLDVGIRHAGPAEPLIPLLRDVVHQLHSDLPISRIATMEERIAESVATPRFYTTILGTFAVLAFLLAGAGVYGSMLYVVGLRKREMGIRVALGAARRDLLRLVIGRGALLVAGGTVLGLAGAFALTRVLKTFLFDVSTTDPLSFAAASALLALTALLACYIPARRAAAADPLATLKAE